jgi:hypothetical protein
VEGWEAVKWLKGLGELLLQLGDLDPEFLFVQDAAIEKLLRQAAADIRYMKQAWEALHDEEKLLEISSNLPWKRSKTGEGEYVAADLAPSLVRAIEARQGRLYAGGFVYTLSRNGKWIQRYVRQRPQAPPQKPASSPRKGEANE